MKNPWIVLAFLFGVNLLNYIDRQILFAVFPPIQAELGLSDTQLGLLASAFMWVYLSTAPVFGLLADRWSRPRLMGLGVAVWSVATAFSGVVRHHRDLLIGRAVVGVGEASYGSVAPALLSDHFVPERRGRALAVFSMAIPVGSALGYLLGGVLEQAFGWRAAFFVVGLPGLFLAWSVGRLPEPPRGALDGTAVMAVGAGLPRKPDYLRLLRTRSYVLNCLAMTAMTFAIGGLAAWVPTYLVRVRGMALAEANLTFGLLTLVSGVGGTVAGGWLGDRLLTRVPAAYFLVSGVGLLLSVPCAAAVILLENRTWVLAAIFLAEVFIFLNTGPLNAIIANVSRAEVRATAYALNIFVIHALGDAISPTIVGMVSDRVGLAAAFWIAPASLTLAALFCFWGMAGFARDVSRLRGSP
ncbi:MAG: MFS transporter [candidate division NC10 bacterium]|nr:MFS transporter [candidate division NC10 bacterium]